jgi:hypothetical protein
MPKTIKGARIIHKRSNVPGVSPTIPPNDDHTTGWLNTDIYIGELFVNTSSTEPKIWFRESSGTTEIATLDDNSRLPKEQLTSNEQNIVDDHSSTGTITTSVIIDTQYINISTISSSISISGVSDIVLDNLETTLTNIYYISLYMEGGGTGCNLITNIKSTSEGTIITDSVSNLDTLKKGICLMWTGAMWIIVSNTTN